MNHGGIPYTISNPADAPAMPYSTDLSAKGWEFFDVYGKVTTRYSQVYWTRNAPYDLPPALVTRFAGKVMAIVGYEIDQVVTKNATAKVNTLDDDISVPIYNA